jgi:3-hydroxyacyl-[acyl-carrier-protein] dehydratase
LVAYQTIPTDNPFLAGHFPGFPIWPGALLLEAMAQATAIYLLESREGLQDDEVPVLGAVDCRFLHPVFPGERICYRAELVRQVGDLGLFSVTASRDSEIVARGRISAGLTRRSVLSNPSS